MARFIKLPDATGLQTIIDVEKIIFIQESKVTVNSKNVDGVYLEMNDNVAFRFPISIDEFSNMITPADVHPDSQYYIY